MPENEKKSIPRLLTMQAACKYLSCSLDTLEDLIAMGELPVVRFSRPPARGKRDRRKRWIDIKDLDSLIEAKKEKIGE